MTLAAIMPHYNHGEFIREAVDSVKSQVDLLVIVDDGSSDAAARDAIHALDNDGDHVVLQLSENAGTANAINHGWLFANAHFQPEYLTWVSADNVYYPGWAEALISHAEETGSDAVYSGFHFDNGSTRRTVYTEYGSKPLIDPPHHSFPGPSFVMRREAWAAVGMHRGRNAHDYDHWLRFEESGAKISSIPDALCRFRAHKKRSTITRPEQADQSHWASEARRRRDLFRV